MYLEISQQVSIAVAKNKPSSVTSSIEPSTASAIASMVTGGNQGTPIRLYGYIYANVSILF